MRILLKAFLSVSILVAGSHALAQQGAQSLPNKNERLEDLAYGLQQVCIPAQRAQQSLGEYESRNREALKIVRRQVANSTKVGMWLIGSRSDVAILEDQNGCTVSMSMWEKDANKIIPDMRGYLTANADQYQVLAGDPEKRSDPLNVAFCANAGPGIVDSWYLTEFAGNWEDIPGQRRRERQIFISIIVPTEPFCPGNE